MQRPRQHGAGLQPRPRRRAQPFGDRLAAAAERRTFPAIDIELSGTRKEELLLGADVTKRLYTLRRVLARMNALDAMPLLIDRLMKTDSNKQFLDSFRLED